ncbi:MAG: RDAC family protein [Bacillota bacterium]|jgi:hypothetical protein
MKVIITFNEVIELNKLIEEQKLPYRVHLSDACGNQSLWIEPLGEQDSAKFFEPLHSLIEDYFRQKDISVKFIKEGLDFILQ